MECLVIILVDYTGFVTFWIAYPLLPKATVWLVWGKFNCLNIGNGLLKFWSIVSLGLIRMAVTLSVHISLLATYLVDEA